MNTLLNGVVTLLALPEFNKQAGDYWTALVGIIAACISSIIVGVSTVDWMLFFGKSLHIFISSTLYVVTASPLNFNSANLSIVAYMVSTRARLI